jgi:hypothetical protein
MPETITSLIIGAVGGGVAAAIQYGFRRYAESEQVRREVVETHLLQLQNSVESLYYRVNNLRDWSGRAVMTEDYYRRSSAYVLGRVLAHEALLVAKGVYAKLHRNTALKRKVKAGLHSLNWAMDDQSFLHYHRVQLGDMLLDGSRVITYTEFLERWSEPRFAEVVASVSGFLKAVEPERLDRMRADAAGLLALLARQTRVPSALELAGDDA